MSKRLKGLTIVETVVYIALFGIIISTVITFAMSLQESQRKASKNTTVEQNAMFIFEHLNSNMAKTVTIDTTQSILDNDNGKLHINFTGGSGDYSLSNSTLVYSDGTTTSPISLPTIKVTKFRVEPRYYKGTELVAVSVILIIDGKTFDTTFTIK